MSSEAADEDDGRERAASAVGTHGRLACLEEDEEGLAVVEVTLAGATAGAVPLRRLLRLGPPTNLNSRGVWTWAMVEVSVCSDVQMSRWFQCLVFPELPSQENVEKPNNS